MNDATDVSADARAYLCVDDFLRTFTDTQSVSAGLKLGIIDALAGAEPVNFETLHARVGGQEAGLLFLLDLLRASGALEAQSGVYWVTEKFRVALQFRDLMEAKIEFANLCATDLAEHFTAMIHDPREFQRRARIFRLFSYDRCSEYTPENYALTQRWVGFTTALTRYEAGVALERHDFSAHRRMLDVGGNSGEFVRQICRRHRELRATVFDLPLVCDVGREHLSREPASARIDFLEGDGLREPMPPGRDLISFKSMLHDWPDAQAKHFLANAAEALAPGGTLLIFERGRFEVTGETLPYSVLPLLPFAHAYRDPAFYVEALSALGFRAIAVERMTLEMPWFLLTARKEEGGPGHGFSSVRWT